MEQRYDPKKAEKKWIKRWERSLKFDPDSSDKIYSIDTPPPTVSGKMHMGHAFSYTQQDFIVRFQRMLGKNIFYPFGTDDNGIATERLIEKLKNVKAVNMDRDAFRKLCLYALVKLRQQYINDMKALGISCDWDIYYTTINEHCARISQRSFIELYRLGREYRKEAPFMWCPRCQTAISQVECEDKELDSHFNDIIFKVDGKQDLIIATTRPEFLAATVAVFFHPDDSRYKEYLGKEAEVPLFNYKVPIMTDESCDPEKGTGIMMVCTFGDQEDTEKWLKYKLPLRDLITKDGRLSDLGGKYKGKTIHEARSLIIKDLQSSGLLIKQEQIRHSVRTHERCGTEIEFIHTKQWFIRYLDLKKEMLRWGSQLNWYPKHMKVRYDNWVKGLQWDWCISRQRYSGIPFPVWYCKKCEDIILANKKDLPVDPLKDKPPVKKCPKCGSSSFVPEKDIMDTWATSSLTPQLAVELFDKKIQKKLYPMSLRPQAHDIITFWLFNTVVKSQLHNKVNPWKDVVIPGHALDPHGKKMSKSKGNVVEPQKMVEKYSADCLRFWAAGSKLGDDLPFQEKDLVTGQKFATKLWNASRFVISSLKGYKGQKPELELMDRWLLSKLNRIIKTATETFNRYEYSRTKYEVENFFWHTLCDNYLEIVKDRIYNPGKRGEDAKLSAQFTLNYSLLSILKMMAPIMPFVTEEIYSSHFSESSIHTSRWPEFEKYLIDDKAEELGDFFISALSEIRRFKSNSNLSLGSEVSHIEIRGKLEESDFNLIKDDLLGASKAKVIQYSKLDEKFEEDFEIDIKV